MKTRNKQITLSHGLSIGNNSAEEDDEFLFRCFIRTNAYDELTNFDSPKMFAAGRTGAGKTAILRQIKQEFGKTTDIDPFEVSLGFIANSDILNFLQAVGADLDLLFQVLWKHVLCVEYVRLRYSVRDESKWQTVLNRIQQIVDGDHRKRRALENLKCFDGKFWVPFDENIKEVVEKITRQLEAEFAPEFDKFKSKVHYDRGMSAEKRAEIVNRCKKIITPDQLRDLSQLIDLLAEEDNNQAKHFILIDKLDENWIEDQLRFRMIRALIEALRGFRKIRRLKIVVALRSDVLERVIQETERLGFQKEKYEDYICDLRWTKAQLKQLIKERLEHLSSTKFQGKQIDLKTLFPKTVGPREPFDYMLDRTLNRPRDVLSFLNHCFRNAAGKHEITASVIREAERDYSIGRYQALIDEWKGAFFFLPSVLNFLGHVKQTSTMEELKADEKLDELILHMTQDSPNRKDRVYELAEAALEGDRTNSGCRLLLAVTEVLYRIGAVGIKPSSSDRFLYSHIDMPLIPQSALTNAARVRIHPMLLRALNLNSEDGEKNG